MNTHSYTTPHRYFYGLILQKDEVYFNFSPVDLIQLKKYQATFEWLTNV